MVALLEEDRESQWIQVQSKKSCRIAQKKGNKVQASCKYHASPDFLTNVDTTSVDDSASYADVLMGKKKPSKLTCKRTLNLLHETGKKDTVITIRTIIIMTLVYPPLLLQT